MTITTRSAAQDASGGYDPIAAVRSLAPRIRELAPAIERERRLPPALVASLLDAGLFHLLLPHDLGGREVDPVTAARVVEEAARADGSTGWCLMLAAQSASFAGNLSADCAREIWGGGGIVAGSARPIGRAKRVSQPAEGYLISGRWPFASGSSHATWFAPECTVYDGDEVHLDRNGNAVTRMVFVPREVVTVEDNWDTLGLRGTASNDFSVADAFVPAERGFQVLVDPPRHDWPLYRALPLVFINHGSHALGVARGAIDTAIEIATTKKGWGDRPLREIPRVQASIAEATALVESARRYLYDTAGELWELALAGGDDAQLRASVRLATSNAMQASVRAADLVQALMGTSSIFSSSPLQRHFRDLHTASAHVMIGAMTYEAAGRVILGLDAEFPFF